MPQRLRVISVQGALAAPTGSRFDRQHLVDLVRWDQGSLLGRVPRLSTALASGLGLRRAAFDVRSIAGRRPRRIGGVLSEALLEILNLALQGLEALLVSLDQSEDC